MSSPGFSIGFSNSLSPDGTGFSISSTPQNFVYNYTSINS